MARISLITCVNNKEQYDGLLATVPKEIEHLSMWSAKSMAEGYNAMAAEAQGDILGFIHQDVRFLNPEWPSLIAEGFRYAEHVGVIGFVGSSEMTIDGRWWLSGNRRGNFLQGDAPVDYGEADGKLHIVSSVDGYAMFVTREAFEKSGGFDETYSGWHMYDSDLCTNLRLNHGYGIRVLAQCLTQHLSGGVLDEDWQVCQKIFMEKWKGLLAN